MPTYHQPHITTDETRHNGRARRPPASCHAGQFRRELLPSPRAFYEREFGHLPRADSRGWVRLKHACFKCGHHGFGVNLDSGGYSCLSCGTHGDMISFLRERYRLSFKEAAQQLGAWDTQALPDAARRKVEAQRQLRQRAQAAASRLEAEEHQLRMEIRDWLHLLERVQRTARARIGALHHGEREQFPGEEELQWGILADIEPQIRRAVAAYYLVTFAATAERDAFILHPDGREAAIKQVLHCGQIRNEQGRGIEVEL